LDIYQHSRAAIIIYYTFILILGSQQMMHLQDPKIKPGRYLLYDLSVYSLINTAKNILQDIIQVTK